MLACVSCSCGGAEPLIRSTLKEAGIKNWLNLPIHSGKEKTLLFLESLPIGYRKTLQWGALYSHVQNHSSYAVIIGYDDKRFRWADVAMGDLKSKLDGEAIAKQFEVC